MTWYKRKQLRLCCIIPLFQLLLLFVLSVASDRWPPPVLARFVGGWTGEQQQQQEEEPAKLLEDSFTLMTLSHSPRLLALTSWVAHYGSCSGVEELVIVWSNGPIDQSRELPEVPVPVRVRMEATNSLNNRFLPDHKIRTRAVLMLDDDVIIRCEDISAAFAAWRDHPDKLVGFFPRKAVLHPQRPVYSPYFNYQKGSYNLMLTKGTFMDVRSFDFYFRPQYAEARQLVDTWFNCEDILMNFVWAKEMRAEQGGAANSTVLFSNPRCFLETSKLCRKPGVNWSISKGPRGKTHLNARAHCVQRFGELLGADLLTDVPNDRSTVGPKEIWVDKVEGWIVEGPESSVGRLLRTRCPQALVRSNKGHTQVLQMRY